MNKILLIEDELVTAQLMKRKLKKSNYEVMHAEDAYQGIELALREKPDLIILDMMLPAGGGLTVLQRLRVSRHTRDIPVIAHTSATDEKLKSQVMNKGVSAYILKPYSHENMITAIKNILE